MDGRQRATALAVAAPWLANGLVTGSLSVKLPELAEKLGLTEGWLGLALAGQTIGLAAVMFTLADRLVVRFGGGRVALVAGVAYSASLAIPGVAGGVAALFMALLVVGALNAPLDVANAALVGELQKRTGRELMAKYELSFNAGLVGAAGIAAAVALAGLAEVGVGTYLASVAALAAVVVVAAATVLRRFRAAPRSSAAEQSEPAAGSAPAVARGRLGLSPAVVRLALLATAALWLEATVLDWIGLFFVRELGTGSGQVALGLACFTGALMVALWCGERLERWLGPVRLVAAGAVLFAAGLATTLYSGSVLGAGVGLVLAGAGFANAHPLAVSAAERVGGPTALARVYGLSFIGLVLAKPFIGGLAELTDLRTALASGLAFAVAIVALAPAVRRDDLGPEEVVGS